MRKSTSFAPSLGQPLEARDVPSAVAVSPNFLRAGDPLPPIHVYPPGIITPYYVRQGQPPPVPHVYPPYIVPYARFR